MSARTRFQELGSTARRRVLWGVIAAVLLSTSLLALGQAGHVRASLIADATTSAEALVDAALAPVLTPADAAVPATGTRYAVLAGAVERQILADGTVLAVTIWAGDGTILFAEDVSLVGDEVRAMRTTVLSVIGDEPHSDVFHGLVRSFVPVELATGVSVAVELDRSADPIASAADPWRLMALLAGAGALLSGLLLARTFTRYGRRVEGFDEDVLRAAVAGHRRAERGREEAESRHDAIAAELAHTREVLRETEQRAREAARTADDTPRLREHLSITAEDLKRAEQERDALRERLVETGRAVEAEAARGREEVAGALAEIERLEGVKLSLQDRAAKAEEAVAELTKQVAELSARPDVEAELASTRREIEATGRDLAAARERAEQAERRGGELEDAVAELGAQVRDLERRPDLSAKLDAASAALDIAREQIRALTARADASDTEATKLQVELDRRQDARSKELEEATIALAKTRSELERAGSQLRVVIAENGSLRDEVESLRSESDAAGQMIAAVKAELLQTTEHAKSLTARAKEAEAALEREREASAQALQKEHASASAELATTREALDARAAELDSMTAERASLTVERDALRSEGDAKAEEIRLARRETEDLRAALARAETDLVAVRATAEGERGRADGLAVERDAAQAEIEAARVEIETMRTEMETVRAGVDTARAEAETAGTGAAELQEELQRAKATVTGSRAEVDALRAELRTALADAEDARSDLGRVRAEDDEARADADTRAEEAEARAVRAIARAELAEEMYAEAEARFTRTRSTEATGTERPVAVSAGPEGPAVKVQLEPPHVQAVNGSRHPSRGAAKVEVDALVRRMVQESWSDRGRMVSVYAESVVVEAAPGTIESIVEGLLERSVARTTEGNRIVLHVERAEDGAMLSVEDGRPPDDDAVSPETRRLAAELGGWANVEEHLGGGAISRVFLPHSASAGAGVLPA